MTARTRRSTLGLLCAATLVLTVASTAWACTGTHAGDVWFCGGTSCSFGTRIGRDTAHKASSTGSYYINASGLDHSNTYNPRYVSGDDTNGNLCNTGTIFKVSSDHTTNASFTTDSSGNVSGGGPVDMPSAGTYTICAIPTVSGNGTFHDLFYVM